MMDKSTQTDAQMDSLTTSISNLEVQMGQISHALNFRPKGALPSNPVAIILKVQRRENGKLWGLCQQNIKKITTHLQLWRG